MTATRMSRRPELWVACQFPALADMQFASIFKFPGYGARNLSATIQSATKFPS